MDQLTPTELTRLMDYFAQALDPDEMALVECWIAERVERRQFVEDLRRSRIDLGSDSAAASWNLSSRVEAVAHTLADVWTNASADQDVQISPSLHDRRAISSHRGSKTVAQLPRMAWYTMGTIAASVLLVVAGWYVGQRGQLDASTVMSTYTTGPGERATIALPDGSSILMNVASRVQIPTSYSANNRTIQLTGEALFTVVPLPGAPFTVVAGPGTTRVLGTSFTVRHYDTDTAATVAVREGKVAVGTVVLTARQSAVVAASGTPRVAVANDRQFDFARGVLELDDEPFRDAILELNRWYNVEIRLGDTALTEQRILGTFEAGSITDLVSILEFTFHVRVVRDGRVLTLYKGR